MAPLSLRCGPAVGRSGQCGRPGCRPSIRRTHKLYGPRYRLLYVRGGTRAIALNRWPTAATRNGLRSGTTNVPGAVGSTCTIAQAELTDEMARLTALRDTLETALLAEIDGLWINAQYRPSARRRA
jgi:cysteine sulfinate desulfinase/cysteine desulfurase-like protein